MYIHLAYGKYMVKVFGFILKFDIIVHFFCFSNFSYHFKADLINEISKISDAKTFANSIASVTATIDTFSVLSLNTYPN